MIKQYLDKIKECIANGHLTFAPRDKNVKFMMEYGLLEEDIKDTSEVNEGLNYKPGSKHIKAGSLLIGGGVGYGMADRLKYINASSTTFEDAALLLGAMGSKTIGVGIIASAQSSTSGYVKFANGLLIQWKIITTTNVTETIPFSFPVDFSSLPVCFGAINRRDSNYPRGTVSIYKLTVSGGSLEVIINNAYSTATYYSVLAIGY